VAWAEEYQESTHEGLSSLVELAALLVMDRPSAAAVSDDSALGVVGPDGVVPTDTR
jgi:hypothetical protein